MSMHKFAVRVKDIKNALPPAGFGQVGLGHCRPVWRFIAGQMTVIMVLVDYQHIPGSVHCHSENSTGVVDHPVIPGRASNRKVGHVGVEVARENKIIDPPG